MEKIYISDDYIGGLKINFINSEIILVDSIEIDGLYFTWFFNEINLNKNKFAKYIYDIGTRICCLNYIEDSPYIVNDMQKLSKDLLKYINNNKENLNDSLIEITTVLIDLINKNKLENNSMIVYWN